MDDDWRPEDDDDDTTAATAKIVFLPIPEELKEKGVKAITYARTFISIDYKGKIFTFTVYKEDITKTHGIYEKELDHEVDEVIRNEIWFCISSNWLKHIYTEEEIEREVLGRDGKADMILQLAQKNCQQIFLDEYKVAHAAVMINDGLEVVPLADERFKNWLRKMVGKEYKIIIGSSLIEDVVNTLTAVALFDGQIIGLGLRFAATSKDEFKWNYDLTNESREFIEITPEGWKVVKNKIIFRRFSHQIPQVYPEPNYPPDIFDQFMNLLNIKKEDRLLLKCYTIVTFIPDLIKAVLMVHGEQGTAKSMLQELLVMLIDPTLTKTLTFPKDKAELILELSHHAVAYYDNLSRIHEWTSDQLCKAVTGGGSSNRKLYTNNDDVIYVLMRAIGFNGINLAATKADLLSRGLIIQTETIPKGNQRRMKSIWAEFDRIKPQLLGYIFDILVKVLKWKKDNPGVELVKEYPRLADWAECCEIVAHCMGEKDGAFMEAYTQNVDLQTQAVIEGSDLAIALQIFIDTVYEWKGSATQLLEKLQGIASGNGIDTKNTYWPKTANRLSRYLKILQKTLRDVGIEIMWLRDTSTKKGARIIKIVRLSSEPSDCQKEEKPSPAQTKTSDDRTISDDRNTNSN